MGKTKIIGMPWRFDLLMNEAITCLPRKPMVKRDYIWASELGGDFATRYLKMHAHIPSNPPNERSKRKFVSGDMFEWVVELVLTMCGVLKKKQLHGVVELPGLLKVTGRLDFIAGGTIDWEFAKAEVERMKSVFDITLSDMPPFILHAIERILFRMEQMFSRVPLKEMIIECKSVSGFVGDLIEKTNTPRPGHPFQTLHYVIANKIDGSLLYINKDSFMCYQFDVFPTKGALLLYRTDVAQMTEYYNASGKNYLKNIPPKAPEIIFEPATYRFVKNNQVEYSPYLSFLYPAYKNFDDYNERWKKPIASWNRTFKRCVQGANMTALNKSVVDEASRVFPEWDKYVQLAKNTGAFSKPEEGEDE